MSVGGGLAVEVFINDIVAHDSLEALEVQHQRAARSYLPTTDTIAVRFRSGDLC